MKKILLFVIVYCLIIASASMLAAQETQPTAPSPQGTSVDQRAVTTGSMDIIFPAPCLMSSLHIINSSATPMLGSRLKLSDDQKTKVSDLLKEADKTLKPIIEDQRKKNEKYTQLLLKNDTSESTLLAAAEETMRAESVIVAQRIKTLEALRTLLNDQQKNDLNMVLGVLTASWQMKSIGIRQMPIQPEPPPTATEMKLH